MAERWPFTGGRVSVGLLGVDISNYSGPANAGSLAAWKAGGVGTVAVQAVSPAYPYPPGQTRQQCQAVLDAGLQLDAYVYLFFSESMQELMYRLGLLDGFPIRRLWLDVEDTTGGFRPTHRASIVMQALGTCDAYPTRLATTGIYTGAWFWGPYMGGTTQFANRPLWASQYDGVADPAQVTLFGGWSHAAVKQYQGTSALDGQPNVDLDVYSLSEIEA